MTDFSIRSDSVNVEEIMRQIRARIREKRGVDYTEQEIHEMAAARLEKFLDPSKVRSELLEQYRQLQRRQSDPGAEADEETLFGSPRPWLRRVRRWLRPILKLFLNPVPLMRASRLDTIRHAELFYELMHNMVVETTRLGIEVKNLKMRVESLSSRLDFDERRARALEGVVQYRPATAAAVPDAPAPGAPAPGKEEEESDAEPSARNRRRRRRRGRRGGGQRSGAEEGARASEAGQEPAVEGAPTEAEISMPAPASEQMPPDLPADTGRAPEAAPPEPPATAGSMSEPDRGDGDEPGS